MGTVVRNQSSVLLLLIWSVLFLKWSEGACPSHCQSSGSACDTEPDDGCPVCEQEYYGRQCDLGIECRFTVLGTGYRGTKNTTKDGITCQRWDLQYPNSHSQSGPELEENYCRNPDNSGNTNGPWCYTTDPNIRYRGCGIPICSQQCTQPKLPPGASVVNPATPGEGFFVGFTLNIRCPDGVPRQSTCSQSGNVFDWSTFTCPDIYCESPSIVNSHTEPDKPTYLYGERIEIFCDTGYETVDKTQLRCQKNATWDGIFPTCLAVKCAAPNLQKNTHIISPKQTYVYQDAIEVACDKGYESSQFKGSKADHICQANKTWNGTFLTCQVVKCAAPNLDNVTLADSNKSEYTYQENISVTCKMGYEIASSSNIYTCTENKTFDHIVPNCTAVVCPVTELYSSAVLQPKKMTYMYKDVVKFQCLMGFYPNATNEYFTCQADKMWNATFPSCLQKEEKEVKNSNTLGIVLGVLVGCAVIVAAVILFFICRRKCPQQKYSKYPYEKPVKKQDSVLSPKADAELRSNIYVNVSEVCQNSSQELDEENDDENTSPPIVYENEADHYHNFASEKIQISSFSEYIQKKTDKEFSAEFALLKADLQRSTDTALMQKNRNKNKYKSIYPYDDNRVVLESSKSNDSTYINASPILGLNDKIKFIAAQGPIATTLIDFWRMIWQKKLKKIVMLTAPMEAGKLKCVEYWPEQGKSMTVGELTLELQNEDEYADFVVRRINIRVNDKCQTVCQYYFSVWPDKGVPNFTGSLAIFHKKTLEKISNTEAPILVHCSAGVGRTGTFIALDLLLEQAKLEGEVTPFACVEKLRQQRVNMVQTAEQYLFLHIELAKAWKIHTTTIPVHDFQEHYRWLKKADKISGKTNLAIEFQAITDPVFKADSYEAGNRGENKSKNRFQEILPVEAYRPYLHSAKHETDNYINAIFMPSFKQKNHFIVTQTPLKNTVHDLLKIIEQEEAVTIVNLTQCPDSSCGSYFSSVGKFAVTSEEQTETQKGIFCKDLQITNQSKTSTVREFSINFWSDESSVPDSPSGIMNLLSEVKSWQVTKSDPPIIVHCMNGASKCGLYCVLAYLMERLQSEQDVMLPIIVEHMRMRRPQILNNQAQYEFCYQCVENYCAMFETYANFS